MRKLLVPSALVFAAALLGIYFWAWSEGRLGFDPDVRDNRWPSIARTCLGLIGLLIGIVFGGLHRLWRERKEPLNFADVRTSLATPELWRSIVAAPLVFTGVYTAAQAQPDMVMSFFFAFQSGFFSDAIVQGKSKNAEKASGSV